MSHTETKELDALLDALCEGTLAGEDATRLNAILGSSRAARRRYLTYMEVHGALHWDHAGATTGTAAEPSTPPHITSGERPERPEVRTVADTEPFARPTPSPRRQLARAAFLGLAASVVLLTGIWALTRTGDRGAPTVLAGDGPPLATLVGQVDAVWEGDGPAPLKGRTLFAGESLRLASGVARLRLGDGTDVVIDGIATVRVEAADRIALDAGRLAARSPASARGFTVRTPDASVVDLGTEFGVRAEAAGTLVEVFEGRVNVDPKGTGTPAASAASREVVAGGAVMVFPGAAAVATASPPAGAFVRNDEFDVRLRAASSGLPADRAAAVAYKLRRDPSLIGYYTFAERAPNAPATPGRLGTINAKPVPGRFPGDEALQFASSADHASVDIPGRHERLTLAAWVRVADIAPRDPDGRPHAPWSSLLMTDGRGVTGDGYVHWQVSALGRLSLSASRARQPQPNYEGGPAGAVTPGGWHHLAVTYDARADRVEFYVDGRRVHAEPTGGQGALEIGTARIGNWADDDGLTRHLAGRVDELTAFSRALSGDEIAELWRAGKPD